VLTFALALLLLKIPQTEIVFGWINRIDRLWHSDNVLAWRDRRGADVSAGLAL
jgi:hypothetical protein